MARSLRLEFPDALYHLTARGNARQLIYRDDTDRLGFLELLGGVCDRFNWRTHAYCLMSNHYHLVIETPEANLARSMRQLNGVYTQAFNRRHRKVDISSRAVTPPSWSTRTDTCLSLRAMWS